MWAERKETGSSFRLFTCEVEGDPGELRHVLTEALASIDSASATGTAGADRDCIKVEVWPSSGRLILYPSRLASWERDENIVYQVAIRQLLLLHDQLAESVLSDEQFEEQLSTVRTPYLQVIADAVAAAAPALSTFVYDSDEPPKLLALHVGSAA